MTIRKLFEPNSIAVAGASNDPGNLGHKIIRNLKESDFEGKIYPVNSKEEEILDLKCYPSVEEAPKKTQLLVIATEPEKVSETLEGCSENNVSNAVVISSGFSETEEEGKKLEKEVVKTGEEMGIRILGPNSQGIVNTENGMCSTWPLINKKGSIGIISESNSIGAELIKRAQKDNIGISKMATFGNKADIDEVDLIEYFGKDDETDIIALYLERIKKGREFLSVVEEVSKEKPILVLKGGKTERAMEEIKRIEEEGMGDYRIFESACRQAGLTQVENLDTLYNICKGIATMPKPEGKNTVIVTNTKGGSVLALDAAENTSINMIDIPENCKERLRETLPDDIPIKNPLNLHRRADAEKFDKAIKILARYKDVQNLVTIVGTPTAETAEVIERRFERLPIIPIVLGKGEFDMEKSDSLKQRGIPVFSEPQMAMKVLNSL
ncbi:MAG: CoA-binding protein [Candidatus Hadarchaeia archaeon]